MSSVVFESRTLPVQKRRRRASTNLPNVPPKSRALAAPEQPAVPAMPLSDLPAWYRSEAYELVNALTHGAGLALSIVGGLVMAATVYSTGDPWRISGCGVFVAAMMAVFAASTLSHSGFAARWRTSLRRLDQGTIYFLVVATYTPFGLAYLRTGAGWLLLAALWGGAIAGFLSKFFLSHKLDGNMLWSYILLGALPTVTIPWLWSAVPFGATVWMFLGGLCYLLGTIFLMNDSRVRHFHAVWHLLVIAGSTCHFLGILTAVARAAG